MHLWPFARQQTQTQPQPQLEKPIGFEPEEQKTPFLGRVILLVLAVVLLFFGWRGLDDLRTIPNEPEQLSYCFTGVTKAEDFPTYVFEERTCQFSSYESAAGVQEKFEAAKLAYQPVQRSQDRIDSLKLQISSYQGTYDTSLLEDIAEEEALRATPQATRDAIRTLEQQITEERGRFSLADTQFRATLPTLIAAFEKADGAYQHDANLYEFWVFLLEFAFSLPFFGASLWFYRRLHGRSSPHTVIAIPIVAVASILFARVILVFFWDLFLADLIEALWQFFTAVAILRTLLYYFGMFLAIVVFGGAVYRLQKAVFAPWRVRTRRLRAKKCPYCEVSLDLSKNYCPSCGKQVLAQCASCGQARYIDLRYCPSCGKEAP